MMNYNFIDWCVLLITWQSLLISAAVVLVGAGIAFLFFNSRMQKSKHEISVLQQRIIESTELLDYTKESEQRARQEADDANNAKSLLLAKLSHEIRTPMNGVIGMASLLAETKLTEEQREYADVIIQSSENLITTINDMMVTDVIHYSENSAGRMELEEKDYDVRNTVENVLETFAGKAAQAGVELVYSMEKDVPEMLVGDEVRLRQIIMNLVENALRFTKKGEILIIVRLLRILEGNQADVCFEIRDTGTGMSANEIEILSKDIEDVNTKNDSNELTLIISKKLVNLMGGKFEIETKEGHSSGTIIKFKIRTRVSLQPQREKAKFNNARSQNILLVDDNFTIRNTLKKQLEQWDLLPTIASSATEAIDMCNRNYFDLVITDMEMPHINGIELARAVKKINPKTDVLLMHTVDDEQHRNHINLFNGVIAKPVKQHLLYKYIAQQLNGKDLTSVQLSDKPKTTVDFAKNHPLHILLVEDNKTNQEVAIKILSKLGYDVELAHDGEEALEMVSDGKYDLIFMDIQMPGKDGYETTRMLRLCLNTQPVIIAMTANAIQGDRQKCLQSGMDDYLSKPFRIEELTRMIEKWATQLKV